MGVNQPMDCRLATAKTIRAEYCNGMLAICVEGELFSSCYQVGIRRGLLAVEPPEFEIEQCQKSGVVCTQIKVPYKITRLFSIGPYRATIVIHDSRGIHQVSVIHIQAAERVVLSAGGGGGGGEIPSPFLIPPSMQSNAGSDKATGYSDNYSFEEAFVNAMRTLPSRQSQVADELFRIRIVEIGAEVGGFAGFNHMFVTVEALAVPGVTESTSLDKEQQE